MFTGLSPQQMQKDLFQKCNVPQNKIEMSIGIEFNNWVTKIKI
jgi:hypothetical protein